MGRTGLTCREFVGEVVGRADVAGLQRSYPSIAKDFPRPLLARYSAEPPYFCHFMLWRLATLTGKQLTRLDALLRGAEAIPGWAQEAPSLLASRDFAEFWSLLWQLQMAEFLIAQGFTVRWGSKGPDLEAQRDGARVFVECLVPRKQYGKVVFLQELAQQLHPQLRLSKPLFLPVPVPDEAEFSAALDSIVGWITSPGRLDALETEALKSYPILVPVPQDWSMSLYFEGIDPQAYQPGILPQGGGNPDAYLEAMLGEAARGKQDSNGLGSHHPNVLAVNLLLDDLQVGFSVGQLGALVVGTAIDQLAWGAVGIDEAIRPGTMTCLDGASCSASPWAP